MMITIVFIAILVASYFTISSETSNTDPEDPSEKRVTKYKKKGMITRLNIRNGIYYYSIETDDGEEYHIKSTTEFIVSDIVLLTIIYDRVYNEIIEVFIDNDYNNINIL